MSCENDKIERSAGTFVAVGGAAARVGGGYRGKREDQDEAVKEFARRLADEFPHNIQIRYNSDRLGGGAWLKNSGGLMGNAQVGLGADLTYTGRWRQRRDTFYEWFSEYGGLEIRDFPSMKDFDPDDLALKYSVKLDPPAIDGDMCNRREDDPEKRYFHRRFDSLEEAWSFFIENVNRDGVLPPTE